MKDERDELLDKLFQTARSMKPDTSVVEEHFETRLRARIGERRRDEQVWSMWTWRLVPLFSVLVMVVGIGVASFDNTRSFDLSVLGNGYEEYLATSVLAGG